jgi:hypothetical protein
MNAALLIQLATGFAAGAAAAWLFLRLLQASVRGLPGHPHPGRALVVGFVLRAALVVAVFALVARFAQGPGLAAALAGFLVLRSWRLRQVRREGTPR